MTRRAVYYGMAIFVEAPKPLTRITAAIQRQLNIVFFGTPLFAVPSLRLLHDEGWAITAVVTAPDKPVGRRMTLTPSPVHTAASELGIRVHTPQTLKDDAFFAVFDALKPDLCIVVAYGRLIPDRFLKVPRLGFINVHPSLLPAYRGPSPVQSAILDGCASTGVSIMLLDADMDHGPVLASTPWVIPGGFDAALCEDELSRVGARLLADTLPGYLDGTVIPVPQRHELATYCSKFNRSDGRLDWHRPATDVVNRIRALGANPGTWTSWDGKVLNVYHAHLFDGPIPVSAPGTTHLLGSELVVTCGDGGIGLEVLQREGSTRQNVREFLNGSPGLVGAILGT